MKLLVKCDERGVVRHNPLLRVFFIGSKRNCDRLTDADSYGSRTYCVPYYPATALVENWAEVL
jgi:hypothetical protein